MSVSKSSDQQIVPGISVTSSGLATVDPSLANVLFDLAIPLEELTNLPVDVERRRLERRQTGHRRWTVCIGSRITFRITFNSSKRRSGRYDNDLRPLRKYLLLGT